VLIVSNDFVLPIFRPLGIDSKSFSRRVDQIQASHRFSNFGSQEEELRTRVAAMAGVSADNVVTFSNGFTALRGAISTDPGESWTVPEFSFSGCPLAILDSGREAQIVDISEETWTSPLDGPNIDTTCDLRLVPFGKAFDAKEYESRGRPTLIDAAASLGNLRDSLKIGNETVVMFSFHATKIFGSGEGGIAIAANPERADRMRRWSNFGISEDGTTTAIGVNAKLSEFSAAAVNINLERRTEIIDRFLELRSLAVEVEREFDLDGWLRISDISPYWIVRMPTPSTADSLIELGRLHSVEFRAWWRTKASTINHPRLDSSHSGFPIAHKLFGSVVGLPFWPGMATRDFDLIRRVLERLGKSK